MFNCACKVGCAIILFVLSGCGGTSGGKAKSDLEQLQGKWSRYWTDTQSLDQDKVRETWTFKDDKVTCKVGGKYKTLVFEINQTVNPKRMDLLLPEGDETIRADMANGDRVKCIYKLEGDTLTIHYHDSWFRPVDFAAPHPILHTAPGPVFHRAK